MKIASASPPASAPRQSPARSVILDRAADKAFVRHPWLHTLGFSVLALLGLLLLFVLARLVLIAHLQGALLDPLGRVMRRLDLSSGATRLVNMATFGCSAASLGLVVRLLLRLLLPFEKFRLSIKEGVLMAALFGLPLLAPDLARKACPVREVNPLTTAWFAEAEDDGGTPHGLIGYVHDQEDEEKENWWFCNVRGGPRPSDGALIQPVTPAVHRQWKQWLDQQAKRTTAAEAERHALLQREAEQAAILQRQMDQQKRQDQERKDRDVAERHAMIDKAEAMRRAAEAAAEKARTERLAGEAALEKQKHDATQAAARLPELKKATAEAEARAAGEQMRAAPAEVKASGQSWPRAGDAMPGGNPSRPGREILADSPVRLVRTSEVPFPGQPCGHCGHLPMAHVWFQGRMKCPSPRGCSHCGQPLSHHRHLRERIGSTVTERLVCPH